MTLQRTLGNRAVSRLVQGSDLQVQRLMAPDAFRRRTTLFGESLFGRDRQKVTAIDTALGAYHAVTPVSGANIATKKARLDDVVARCDTYLADVSGSAKRKEGVRELRQEAQREDTVIAPLAASEVAATAVDRFERLTEAQDAQVRLQQDGHITRDIVPMDPWFMNGLTALRADPTGHAMQQVLQREMDQLTAIRDAPTTPTLTRQILTEVLANAPQVTVKAAVGSPMANFVDPTNKALGYEVFHNLNAPMGTAERLGSLTHELTHVSMSVSFDNTSLFLAFKAGATDQQILALSRNRTRQLRELERLMESDRAFNPDQKLLLRGKLQYPHEGAKGDIRRYLPRFQAELGPRYGALTALANQGLNNTVIEFDTVVNQMMMYLHLWRTPPGSRFYTRLRAVAQEAYDYRAAARAGGP